MFCPQCGNNLPDDAKFCNACGNQVAVSAPVQGAPATPAPQAQTPQAPAAQMPPVQPASQPATGQMPQVPSVATSSSGIPMELAGVNIFSVIAVGIAVFALLFAILPWLETSYLLQGVGAAGNALGQLGSALTGKSSNLATFEETYSAIGFFGFSGALSQYWGANPYGLLLNGVAFFWLIAVIAIIGGAIVMFVNDKHINFIFLGGLALLAFVSLIWSFAYGTLVKEGIAVGSPTCAIVCFLLCAIGVALNVIAIVKPDLLKGH